MRSGSYRRLNSPFGRNLDALDIVFSFASDASDIASYFASSLLSENLERCSCSCLRYAIFLGQWRLKRLWRRRWTLSHHRRRFQHRRCCRRQNHSSRCRWHGGLLERDPPRLSQILSIFLFCSPLQEILFSFLELFLPTTLDLLSVFQGLGHSL